MEDQKFSSPKKAGNISSSTESATSSPQKSDDIDEDSISWQKLESPRKAIGRDPNDPESYEVEKICHHRYPIDRDGKKNTDSFLIQWKAWGQ